MSKDETAPRKSAVERLVNAVEKFGNLLPHPFWLFAFFIVVILALSVVCSKSGLSVTYVAAKAGEAPAETTVSVVNLVSYEVVRGVFANLVKIYATFPPLGLVIVMMLGIGLVERTGLVSALMRKTVLGAPPFLVTAVLAIVASNAHIASDAGTIFVVVIGASVFKAIGRNPWVGIITAHTAASASFVGGFFLTGTDALLSGITQSAAAGMNIPGPTHPLINFFFAFVATFTLAGTTVFVTEKFTKKHLGELPVLRDESEIEKHRLTADENRGLRFALVTSIIYIAALLILTVPQDSLFRGPDGAILPKSPLMSSIMALLFIFFFVVGGAYGVGSRVIKSSADVPKFMAEGLKGSISFMVVVLPAAIFIDLFRTSRLDVVLSVNGAHWLQSAHMGGVPLLICFVLLVVVLDFVLVSGSAKWLIMAPIFVPMLAQVGMPPALVQMAYRIGDSPINAISPVSYYIPVILGIMDQYRPEGQKEAGIGTLISLSLPYTLAFIVILIAQLVLWYVLGLPLGPGVPVHM